MFWCNHDMLSQMQAQILSDPPDLFFEQELGCSFLPFRHAPTTTTKASEVSIV